MKYRILYLIPKEIFLLGLNKGALEINSGRRFNVNYLSITKRWFINVASIVIVILLSVSVLLLLSMRNYYYGVASMALDAYSSDKIASSFSRYEASSSGFEKAGRDFVENFPDKDIMAVWIIDKNGDIILFHNNAKYTPEALPEILEELQKRGFSVCSIGELIYQSDYYVDNQGIQHKNVQ